jgi:hypothetical protein
VHYLALDGVFVAMKIACAVDEIKGLTPGEVKTILNKDKTGRIYQQRCEMETEKEKKALLQKLRLLAKMRKQHEWIAFGQKEAETEEEAETMTDSEASGSTTGELEGE